ncbi:peroxisome proliferator-activated receptor gamma coactivator 1-alpha, partial [Notechis scutatus]|uniref:Peroxisome proliferator-activated receptor gamma coactivator 1-alpha n=1 Tax=Notechis scutatus TaxID=8663 RepID=A0A6J1V442_9SAUR
KIDEENEANLLAVLTETLDSIPVDEDGLPSFDALTNGDVTSENEASPSSVPGSSPPPQETEETSLLKKLLLAPANIQLNYNECSGLGTRNHANSNHRIRTNPALAKTENSWSNKAKSTCQPQKPQRRPCSELLKYLTTSDDLSQAKQTENRHSNRDKYTSKKKALLHSQMHHLQENECYGAPAKQTKSMNLSLPLTPESPNDLKGSPFEKKTMEETLNAELCGTAGLTPPTTPPHKATQDNPFRTSPKPKASCQTVMPPSPKPRCSESSISQGHNLFWKVPEQSELYAQLSKTSGPPVGQEERKTRLLGLRLFGDHDYCQSVLSKTERCLNRSLELQNSSQVELTGWWCPICSSLEQSNQEDERESWQARKLDLPCNNRKLLQDQEIRAELNKHFGSPSQAVFDEETNKTSNLRDYGHYSDEQFSKLSMFINSGLAMEGFLEDSEEENEKISGYTLFDLSPSGSSLDSPCRYSGSPPQPICSTVPKTTLSIQILPAMQALFPCSIFPVEVEVTRQMLQEERRVIYVGRLGSGTTRTELRDRFEVFGEIEECTLNLQDDGDSYGFITYRYTCDAFAALENGNTLRRANEPAFQLYFCGQRQSCKANYADFDSDDFDPASTKSKYDSMDFDSLLKEVQRSFRR